jgi:two-component system chemotaxis response regulator CheB
MFSPHDIITLGASAGGLDAVSSVVCMLPRHSSTALFIVIHASPEGPGLLSGSSPGLPQFLSQSPPAPTTSILATFSSRRLIFTVHRSRRGSASLTARANIVSPNGRSAVSPSGRALRRRVIAIVMSGNVVDGTHGLMFFKHGGRLAIAQDPAEAMIATIPRRTIKNVKLHFILPAKISPGPGDLTMTPAETALVPSRQRALSLVRGCPVALLRGGRANVKR